MVGTRRSRSSADGAASGGALTAGGDDDTSGRALQPEVSSGRSGRRLSSTGDDVCGNPPACGPSAQLPAIAEEDGSGASAAQSHRRAARARQQIHGQQQQQQQQIQEQQNPSQQQSQVQEQRAYQTGRPAMQVGRCTDADSSSSSDGEGEWDFDSPDMVASLAATIRSALGGAVARPRAAAVQPAAARAPPDADAEQLKHLRWRPDTGLELPHAAAAVVACTAAAAGGRRNRQLAAAGPRVAGGVASADPTAPGGSHTTSGSSPLLAAPPQGAVKPRGLAKAVRAPTLDPAAVRKAERAAAPDTAGKGWFHLPATKITDDVKRDLRLLRLRGAYDPKRFYRSFDETKFPKHFAIGTVQDDPLDYYGGRLTAGQRRATLTEQLLADSELQATRKKRYAKLQEEAQRWTKAKKRKTGLPRKPAPKHRPKH